MEEGPLLSAQWAEVVQKIRRGDETGVQELYAALRDGIRAGLARSVGVQSVDDRLHEVLVIVLEAIRRGQLREPERLMGFVRTVARRRAVAHIRGAALQRRRFVAVSDIEPCAPLDQNPEMCAARLQQLDRVKSVLRELSARDREIMERFYFLEQSPRQICGEMKLSGTQFRLYKSRALARCFDLAHAFQESGRRWFLWRGDSIAVMIRHRN